MTPKFQIGQNLYFVRAASYAGVKETCPDCGGTGRIRVVFHDDTMVSIDCANCAEGYNPPTGKITVYKPKCDVRYGTITGVSIRSSNVEYEISSSEPEPSDDGRYYVGEYHLNEDNVFSTEEDAKVAAAEMFASLIAEKEKQITQKEKPTRTWAWNASYHRSAIKKAKENIEYHTRKLDAAVLHVKEEKNET